MKRIYGLNIAGFVLAALGGFYMLLALILRFAMSDGGDEVFVAFLCVGCGMLVLGFVFLAAYNARKRKIAALVTNGEKIYAKILRVDKVYLYNKNGKVPSVLVCLYTENGVDYIYTSDLIWKEPLLNGDTVGIYIDREHPKRYYVAVEEILLPTVER